MTNPFEGQKVNPFLKDVVTEPREVAFSVKGLNDRVLNGLIAKFALLENGTLPRVQIAPDKAQLITSPDSGFGKSHLLGRLFQELGKRATQIYIRAFQDSSKPWQSILHTTIDDMQLPDLQHGSKFLQLEAFSVGVLGRVAADFLDKSQPGSLEAQQAALRANPLHVFHSIQNKAEWVEWLKGYLNHPESLTELVAVLKARRIDLRGREKAWLKVLFNYAFGTLLSREAALKWLRGEVLEVEEIDLLKLTSADNESKANSTAQECNDLCYRRLLGLCSLSSYYRPFLFCFDQTEAYAIDKGLIKVFGNCLEKMYSQLKNHLTIVTSNAINWSKDIIPNIEKPQLDRISPPTSLEGITISGSRELIINRLKEFDLDGDQALSLFFKQQWLEGNFKNKAEIGVRTFIQNAADRFNTLTKQPPIENKTIPVLFTTQVNEIKTKRHLQRYNQDTLIWFTTILVEGYMGVTVTRPQKGYFSVHWVWLDRSVFFAFERGDNNGSIRAIANESITLLAAHPGKIIKSYLLRTPDLMIIPKPGWKVTIPAINNAKTQGFNIEQLTIDEVCQIHAARELHSNALQGNIIYNGAETLAWLRTHFEPIFKRLSHGSSPLVPRGTSGTGATIDPAGGNKADNGSGLTPTQSDLVLAYVRKHKLIDIAKVLAHLQDTSLEKAVLAMVQAHPNLRAHSGPQSIFIQWRITT